MGCDGLLALGVIIMPEPAMPNGKDEFDIAKGQCCVSHLFVLFLFSGFVCSPLSLFCTTE